MATEEGSASGRNENAMEGHAGGVVRVTYKKPLLLNVCRIAVPRRGISLYSLALYTLK
jgi:hypothetical protein